MFGFASGLNTQYRSLVVQNFDIFVFESPNPESRTHALESMTSFTFIRLSQQRRTANCWTRLLC